MGKAGAISFKDLVEIHGLIDPERPESKIESANLALDRWFATEQRISDVNRATEVLGALYHSLLATDRYAEASVLCWGIVSFDPRPYFVRQVWKCLRGYARLLIMGCGAGGKSYNCYVHDLHDFNRDPWYTTIKIISTTAGHAKAQAMSTFIRLHRESAIPMPGYIRQGFIGMDKDNLRASISELAIDKGSEVQGRSGKLQGFHPYPRRKPHPSFGKMSRVRARLEECEDIPSPVWPGVANLMLTAGGGNVSVAGLFNPRRRDSATAQRAEPQKGWGSFDLDKSEEWESKYNFHVLRLDGAKCENVQRREIVYPGLIDYEGYIGNIANKSDHMTFSRGAYPTEIITMQIVAPYVLDNARGTFIWERNPDPIGSLDSARTALGDRAIFTAGKYGKAIAFEPEGGDIVRFDYPKWALQIEQQFPITKQNWILMGKDVIRICRQLGIKPKWFVMDRTGNASGLHDWLVLKFGADAMGIEWGQAATDLPILEEETQPASELYSNISTEMWFAFAVWAEFGYLAFSPAMDTSQIFAQLTSRQWYYVSKTKRQIEPKEEFAQPKRYGRSPDESDSAVMPVQLIRNRLKQEQRPAIDPGEREPVVPTGEAIADVESYETGDPVDSIEWVY